MTYTGASCMLVEAVVSVATNGDYQRVCTHVAACTLMFHRNIIAVTLAQIYIYWIVISTWIMHSLTELWPQARTLSGDAWLVLWVISHSFKVRLPLM